MSTTTSDITDDMTQFYMASVDGTFPSIASTSTGNFFYVTLINPGDDSIMEIIKVTRCNPYTGLIVCERAQDGTTAKAFPVGSHIEMRMVKAFFDAYQGAGMNRPFFAYRLENKANLPAGWIAADGTTYEKTSVPGKVLASLDSNTKLTWSMTETETTIKAPNLMAKAPTFSTTPGTTVEATTVYGAEASTTVTVDSTSGDNRYAFTSAITTPATISLTPAIYVGAF